jgi:hypothetical protein
MDLLGRATVRICAKEVRIPVFKLGACPFSEANSIVMSATEISDITCVRLQLLP